nr:DnaJ domain-containing protein [Ardenticatenales bacterium]
MAFESDYYERLGLDAAQESKLVRRQYRLLARLFHPDVSAAEDAQARFVALQEAYSILSDEAKRTEYDRWLETQPLFRQPFRMSVQLFPTSLCRSYERQRVYALVEISTPSKAESDGVPLNIIMVLD